MSHYNGSDSDYNYMANIQSGVVLSVFDFCIFIWCVVFCVILNGDLKEVWIPVPGISPPHLCVCPKPRSGFTPAYVVVVNLLCSLI